MIEDEPMAVDQFTAAVLKIAGPDGLAKMRAIAGGSEIWLPQYAKEGTAVVRALGMEDARKVIEELRVYDADGRPMPFPRFYFPRNDATQANRQREVLKLAKQGMNGVEIAVTIGVAVRTVVRHIEKLRATGELPRELPRPAVLRSLAPPSSDHSANVGEMVAHPSDEVP